MVPTPSLEDSLKLVLLCLKYGTLNTDFAAVARDMGLSTSSTASLRLKKLMSKQGGKSTNFTAKEGGQAGTAGNKRSKPAGEENEGPKKRLKKFNATTTADGESSDVENIGEVKSEDKSKVKVEQDGETEIC